MSRLTKRDKAVAVLVAIYFIVAAVGCSHDARVGVQCARSGGVFVHDTAHRPLCISQAAAREGAMRVKP